MKKLLPLLLLMAGCQAREEQNDNQIAPLDENLLADLGNTSAQQDTERLQALVDRAMPSALPANAKPQYRNLRTGVGGAACGEVATSDAKGRAGPYRHFVITPDAVAVIGTGSEIKFNDPSDFLADSWIRWCASPAELKLVETQIDQGPAMVPDPAPGSRLPPVIQDPVPAPPESPLPGRNVSARTAAPPPPAQIDSFSKSVSRPQ